MILALLRRLAGGGFLLGIAAAVALASAAPGVGARGGPLHGEVIAAVGVFAIFLVHGLALSRENLRAGVREWRLHAVVQAFTFVAFPALGAALSRPFARVMPPDLVLGFLFLCALPSTVSSSVAMTAVARGNVAGALFNATLSSVIGVFATPALVGVLARTAGEGIPLGQAVLDLARLLLLPLALGQALRPLAGRWIDRHARLAGAFDRAVVVVLVWQSFCDSVQAGLWTEHGGGLLALAGLGAGIVLALALVLSTAAARAARFPTEDEIAAVFCGSKKTLGGGVPMAKVMFGSHPGLGLVMLPILLYHPLQLLVCAVLAGRWARRR